MGGGVGALGGGQDGERLSYQPTDRMSSAQLDRSVIRASDRCFLDKNPPEGFGGTHTVVSMVRGLES